MANQYGYFDGEPMLFFVGFAGVGLILRLIRGRFGKREESWTDTLWGCLETAVMTLVGGGLARAFILLLWSQAHDSAQGSTLLFAIFFQLPAIAVLVAKALGAGFLVPDALLLTAGIVGCFIGMMDGIYHIHSKYLGHLVLFPLDVTWGLAGNTYACLVHIIDTFFGDHEEDGTTSQHRYNGGFFIDPAFAFTVGNVMSNMSKPPTDDLYAHERFHVRTNRYGGPLYIWSYIAWCVIVGFGVGTVVWFLKRTWYEGHSDKPNLTKPEYYELLKEYGYYNNPWETIAYEIGGATDANAEWKVVWVVILGLIFCAGFVYAVIRVVHPLWI